MNRDQPWWEQAACRTLTPPEIDRLFFNGRDTHGRAGDRDRAAKQICHDCAARRDCLNYAIREEILVGTYGGMTDLERRKTFHNGARRDKGATA